MWNGISDEWQKFLMEKEESPAIQRCAQQCDQITAANSRVDVMEIYRIMRREHQGVILPSALSYVRRQNKSRERMMNLDLGSDGSLDSSGRAHPRRSDR